MIGTTSAHDLLAECDAHGIRLYAAAMADLTIDAPQDALTPDLLGRLKAHKADLLAIVRGEGNRKKSERL